MIAPLGKVASSLDSVRLGFIPGTQLGYMPGSFLGATPAGLTPLMDPTLANAIYASGANSSGAQLYKDNTGAIVDASGNDIDPLTGNLYQDEIAGPYTTPPVIGFPTSPASGIPPAPTSKNWSACESLASPSWLQSIANLVQNSYDGTLTQSQKQALIEQEQACLVNAGMDSATALTTATNDVTGVLIAAKADPSQSTGLPRLPSASSIPTWIWWAAGGLAIVVAASAVRR